MNPAPPLTTPDDLDAQLAGAGWAVLDQAALLTLCGLQAPALQRWLGAWDGLPEDQHLLDGGRYRRRRHGCFVVRGAEVTQVPHRAHWQPVEYNALHGGIQRWFEPLPADWVADPAWSQLLQGLAAVAGRLRGAEPAQAWFVEAHPFRITTAGGIGRPTPEGAHRDGVDLVAVILAQRQGIKGGETRVFDARGPQGVRFTLQESFSALLLDDERVIHETTPLQALQADAEGFRDTLVLTFRQQGFQGPAVLSQEAADEANRNTSA